MERGRLIAVEGIDAVGKKTQSLLLQETLQEKGLGALLIEFPDYQTRIGKEIKAFLSGDRTYPAQLRHMLFAANRWEKLQELNRVAEGTNIIVNRYSESNLVYGVASGLSLDWLMNLEKGLPSTDLVIVLDAPPRILTRRRPGKKDTYEADLKLQETARTNYKKLAKQFDWRVVPATGTIEEVRKSVYDVLSEAF